MSNGKTNQWIFQVQKLWSVVRSIQGLVVAIGSFALPAWALEAAGLFSEYSPISWVLAGFAGLFVFGVSVAIFGYGQSKWVRSKYDAKFLAESGGVDPLERVFERRRIFLNDFVLPSHPFVEGKNFVDCEIVGPANIFLERENNISDVKPISVDAVALSGQTRLFNGYTFRNCSFRNCTFHRVTMFFSPEEVQRIQHLEWLNWISTLPVEVRAREG